MGKRDIAQFWHLMRVDAKVPPKTLPKDTELQILEGTDLELLVWAPELILLKNPNILIKPF